MERPSTGRLPPEIAYATRGAEFAHDPRMTALASPDLELGFESLSNDEVAAASQRSPAFDVAVVATVAAFVTPRENAARPLRTAATTAGIHPELDRRAELLLLTVGTEPARSNRSQGVRSMPGADAITLFFELLALGVVECDGATMT